MQMLKKAIDRFSKMNTIDLVNIPLFIGFLLFILSAIILTIGHIGNIVGVYIIILTFFIWGFMGIPMIIRKEFPYLTIRGWMAVAEGFVFVLFGWGISIVLLVVMIRGR
jgi:hypothetical protein